MTRGLLCYWVWVSACVAQATYTISGTVVSAPDQKPARRALVRIAPVGSAAWESFVTGDDGRFHFDNLGAGKFALSAERRGAQAVFFREHEGYSTAIVTGPGLKSTEIVFPLTAPASISGTVTAEEGEPVRDAQLWLFRRGVVEGKFQARLETTQGSDPAGRFEFDRLKPGVYVVAAQARPWYAQNGFGESQKPGDAELDVGYATTYYGGTNDPKSAYPIKAGDGDSIAIEIKLRAEPAIHVQVNGIGGDGGSGPMIFTLGPDGFLMPANAGFGTIAKRLIISGITAGRYVIADNSKRTDGGIGPRKTLDLTGDCTIDVSDLVGEASEVSAMQAASGPVKGASTVEGLVLKDGQPFAGAMVLLVPREGPGSTLLRRDQSDSDGTFSLPNVAPGRYTIVAIDDGRELAYAEPGVLNAYLKSGRVVDAPEAAGAKLEVAVISRRR